MLKTTDLTRAERHGAAGNFADDSKRRLRARGPDRWGGVSWKNTGDGRRWQARRRDDLQKTRMRHDNEINYVLTAFLFLANTTNTK